VLIQLTTKVVVAVLYLQLACERNSNQSSYKVKKSILFLLFFCSIGAIAQEYIYISAEGIRKVLRVDLGYTQWSMQQQDSATRMARGIHLLNEVKIISAFWKTDWAVTTHDAFYMSLDMGVLANERHSKGIGATMERESKFSTSIAMGYLLMTGYRTEKWGALAGIDFRFWSSQVGDLTMPNLSGPLFYFSRPILGRVEYAFSRNNPDFRLILTGWHASGNSEKRMPYQGLRLELPLSSGGRTWLCATYTKQTALSEDVFYFTPASETVFRQWMIGVRIGQLP